MTFLEQAREKVAQGVPLSQLSEDELEALLDAQGEEAARKSQERWDALTPEQQAEEMRAHRQYFRKRDWVGNRR